MAKTHRKLTLAEKIAANEAALAKARQMAAAEQPQELSGVVVTVTTTGTSPNGDKISTTSTIPEPRIFMNDPLSQQARPIPQPEAQQTATKTAPQAEQSKTAPEPQPTVKPETQQAEQPQSEPLTAEADEAVDEKAAKKAAKAAKKAAKEAEKAAEEAAEEAKRAKKRAKTMPSKIQGTRMDGPIAMAMLFA